LNVLHVLGRLVALEPAQADLLDRICGGHILSSDSLRADGALDISTDFNWKPSCAMKDPKPELSDDTAIDRRLAGTETGSTGRSNRRGKREGASVSSFQGRNKAGRRRAPPPGLGNLDACGLTPPRSVQCR
jgi:hypothetical protein